MYESELISLRKRALNLGLDFEVSFEGPEGGAADCIFYQVKDRDGSLLTSSMNIWDVIRFLYNRTVKNLPNASVFALYHKTAADTEGREITVMTDRYSIVEAAEMYGVKDGRIQAVEHVVLESLSDYDTVTDDYWPEYSMIIDPDDETYDEPVKMDDFDCMAEPYALVEENGTRRLVIELSYTLKLDMEEFCKFAFREWSHEAEQNGWVPLDEESCFWRKRMPDKTCSFVKIVRVAQSGILPYSVVKLDGITVKDGKIFCPETGEASYFSSDSGSVLYSGPGVDDSNIDAVTDWFYQYSGKAKESGELFQDKESAEIYILSQVVRK